MQCSAQKSTYKTISKVKHLEIIAKIQKKIQCLRKN